MPLIDEEFRKLRADGRKLLIPFFVAGDPDLDTTVALLTAVGRAGIRLAEIGFPYSDPIADGPTIQAAYTRALQCGLRVRDVLAAAASLHDAASPVGMVSYALVYRHGIDEWVGQAADAGLVGLIVPDLPSEEAATLDARCRQCGLSLVQLIAPTTSPDRARRILEHASGFVYYVSVAGVTGERTALPPELPERLAALREWTDLPICVGFGVRDTAHARALAPHVDGVIIGSALVKRMELARQRGSTLDQLVCEVVDFCCGLQAALNESSYPSKFS